MVFTYMFSRSYTYWQWYSLISWIYFALLSGSYLFIAVLLHLPVITVRIHFVASYTNSKIVGSCLLHTTTLRLTSGPYTCKSGTLSSKPWAMPWVQCSFFFFSETVFILFSSHMCLYGRLCLGKQLSYILKISFLHSDAIQAGTSCWNVFLSPCPA